MKKLSLQYFPGFSQHILLLNTKEIIYAWLFCVVLEYLTKTSKNNDINRRKYRLTQNEKYLTDFNLLEICAFQSLLLFHGKLQKALIEIEKDTKNLVLPLNPSSKCQLF